MGTINPYRAPFVDSNWIIDKASTICANHLSAKNNFRNAFEMFALLISNSNHFWRNGLLSLNKLFLLFVFFLSSPVKLYHTEDYSTPSSALHIQRFVVGICRGYLPREFASEICRGYLPCVFCICKQILFCICE